MLSGRGICGELITRPEESYRLWCVVVCDLETARIGAPYIYIYIYIYIYDISSLRVNISRPEISTALLLRVQVFLDVKLQRRVNCSGRCVTKDPVASIFES